MMITHEKLLPCPFCGGEASGDSTVKYSDDTAKEQGWGQATFYYCNCSRCGASNLGLVGHRTREEAIAAWNRRTSPPPIWNVTPGEVKAAIAEGPGGIISVEPSSPPAAVPDEWRKLLLAAKILYQNAEGCVANHHARDFKAFGIPGWLADCKRDIENAEASLAGISAAPAAVPEGWVMVPREPTPEMDAAFLKTLDWMNGPTADQQREAWRQENRRRWALMIAAAPAAPTTPKGQRDAVALIRWAHDTLYEINPSNYDHDEVCRLNDASVEVILGLAQFLGERQEAVTDDTERSGAAPAAPNGWRPIETAPRDGTDVLLWDGEEIFVGYWSDSIWVSPGAWVKEEHRSDTVTYIPTHWMPIPAAPTEAGDE